jgi:predicted metal-dependent phosphotriesterase family hydrolase
MEKAALHPSGASRPVRTVLGEIPYDRLGITDAHNHLWIDPVPGADPQAPVLNQFDAIREELELYRAAGGGSLLDCQPGGCGRNAHQLIELSQATGVQIIACTGFHRRKYYTPGHWLFSASSEKAAGYFSGELSSALAETLDGPNPVRAGFIKIALESSWNGTPQCALEGAAAAAQQSGALVEIHTEKGALAEKAAIYFEDQGLRPQQLVLCHMDKRPDPGLHAELARFGALLEYDTFYRPKYQPETKLWVLIDKMVEAGWCQQVALATDMAEAGLYRTLGGGPGLASLPCEIKARLTARGIAEISVQQMLGGNIARRLAGLD